MSERPQDYHRLPSFIYYWLSVFFSFLNIFQCAMRKMSGKKIGSFNDNNVSFSQDIFFSIHWCTCIKEKIFNIYFSRYPKTINQNIFLKNIIHTFFILCNCLSNEKYYYIFSFPIRYFLWFKISFLLLWKGNIYINNLESVMN